MAYERGGAVQENRNQGSQRYTIFLSNPLLYSLPKLLVPHRSADMVVLF